ncbi:nucleotidyltransferase domain-containing protein [Candidatus Woesearchaeota archaeon]|nr:nucleotidyltransferase domain-containing protein [Candidatus Woesearchaeota archaeon]
MIRKYSLFKVIDALINSSKELSLRDVAKKAKVGAGTSKTCLDYLRDKEIVKRKIIGNIHLYSLNDDNLVARHIKILDSLSIIKDSGLIQELLDSHKSIVSIILYGSAARGENGPKSDMDILIISRKPVKLKPLRSEKNIDTEITFIAYTSSEWRRKSVTDKPFYDSIMIDGIALYGEKPAVR